MYIPPSNREDSPRVMLDFIRANPFGVLVTARGGDLFGTHLPFIVEAERGPHGTLLGHLARANPHHRSAPPEEQALVVFSGPDAYVSPRWYPSKREHGAVVPTWNYVAVHVYGTLRFRHDEPFLRDQLRRLTTAHEGSGISAWRMEDAPADYLAQNVKAIVGLEVEISRLEGKWKMSQNRSSADIDGAIDGLAALGERKAAEVAQVMRERQAPAASAMRSDSMDPRRRRDTP